MSKILKSIWSVLMDLAQASHSAHLARNGQIERAKSEMRRLDPYNNGIK
jgi:hypothetical protein